MLISKEQISVGYNSNNGNGAKLRLSYALLTSKPNIHINSFLWQQSKMDARHNTGQRVKSKPSNPGVMSPSEISLS